MTRITPTSCNNKWKVLSLPLLTFFRVCSHTVLPYTLWLTTSLNCWYNIRNVLVGRENDSVCHFEDHNKSQLIKQTRKFVGTDVGNSGECGECVECLHAGHYGCKWYRGRLQGKWVEGERIEQTKTDMAEYGRCDITAEGRHSRGRIHSANQLIPERNERIQIETEERHPMMSRGHVCVANDTGW